ncbi:rhamnose ABC transporter substrate-binding protein [Actinobacteria bacterium YIM 96077]|uniref:Rhamnose ABC transporter substrate-binding protein n=1 Tax=Phytoactinopolyspora halophila TaxID=1981511 RepID=A0A329QPB9_9ACTN|nr:rhamnose ABC transporter substrate-binding protein [Phytoactinopolyspora halophila]AYY12619.1 rhamnose ABC transporter substrate-binding protein [Actinobacteria bacterium YIM 96077]RAW12478.1 rhamnose ABC transporter substrate-binding protein [Phytoactinopolyspora halophila]
MSIGRSLQRIPVHPAAPAAIGLALALALSACGGTTQDSQDDTDSGSDDSDAVADPDADYESGLSLAMLPKSVNNPYFETSSEAAAEVVDELGGDYEYTGPSDATASSQVSYINTVSQQGTDVILLSANDPNALCSSLEQARAAGTVVVTFDSDVDADCRDAFVSQVDDDAVGETLIEMAAEQIGGSGTVAILSATANATNQNAWIDVIEEQIETNPDYADIELAGVAYGDDEDEKSFQETQGLLQANPDLDAIISPTTVGIAAAARYLSSSDQQGEVALTGLGTPNQMREYVEDGTVTEFALWDPGELGELAVYTGAAIASNIITGAEGETFTAGDLGEYTVGEDGVVTLGPPARFNAENIDDYDF